VKIFKWNKEKNDWLKQYRNIGFDDVVFLISEGMLLDILENPNYSNQQIFVLKIDDYAYLVPFVENETEIFLKTIIPSRKATKKYLGGGKNDKET
jgi:disulfide oxidoreductase YuzD